MQPLISVALCTYNGERHLRQQIDSILSQSWQNIELVIVDDRSSDGTDKILRSYTDSRISIYINDQNLGLSKNFEKAISLCKGEFIALSDQDDIWDLEKLEIMLNNIEDHELIYHDSVFIDEMGNSMDVKLSDLRNHPTGGDSLPLILYNAVPGHGLMFRQSLKKHLLPIPEMYHDWWIALVAACVRTIKYLPMCLVSYRQHATSTTDILQRKQNTADRESKSRGREKVASEDRRRDEQMAKAADYQKIAKAPLSGKAKVLTDKLVSHFTRHHTSIFSFSLFYFLLMNLKKVYFVPKMSFFDKVKNAFKLSQGSRHKIYFHRLKNF